MEISILIFQLVVLLFSVMIHEISHGAVALAMGDTTAKDAGRLTLNPAKHLDFVGSFLVPITLFVFSGGAFVLGWAKPVPYNPFRLKNPKLGAGVIGIAGPVSNIVIAAAFAGILRALAPFAELNTIFPTLILLFNFVVYINVLLAVFNLLPIPPLDGANVLFAILPKMFAGIYHALERYGFFILLLFLFFGFQIIIPIIQNFYRLLVGNLAIF